MTEIATEPRIGALEPPFEPELEATLKKWMPPGSEAEPLALFRTLAVHEELMSRMRPLGSGILGHGRVAPRDRELVIDRTCARAGAEYEWGVHVAAFGRAVGLEERQLAATATGAADDPAFSARDALLVGLADQLHETCELSDELWTALGEHFRPDQLLELVIIAGWYRLLSYIINAARIEREPWAARFPSS
jgi:4-carboxymuconolactone decarboxylase